MAESIDRRRYHRVTGERVMAHIGQELVEVIDVSVAGIRVTRPYFFVGQRNIEFRVLSRALDTLGRRQTLTVRGHVVGDTTDHLRIAFASVTPALSRLIASFEEDRSAGHVAAWPPLPTPKEVPELAAYEPD